MGSSLLVAFVLALVGGLLAVVLSPPDAAHKGATRERHAGPRPRPGAGGQGPYVSDHVADGRRALADGHGGDPDRCADAGTPGMGPQRSRPATAARLGSLLVVVGAVTALVTATGLAVGVHLLLRSLQ